jgi:hypothetical protein
MPPMTRKAEQRDIALRFFYYGSAPGMGGVADLGIKPGPARFEIWASLEGDESPPYLEASIAEAYSWQRAARAIAALDRNQLDVDLEQKGIDIHQHTQRLFIVFNHPQQNENAEDDGESINPAQIEVENTENWIAEILILAWCRTPYREMARILTFGSAALLEHLRGCEGSFLAPSFLATFKSVLSDPQISGEQAILSSIVASSNAQVRSRADGRSPTAMSNAYRGVAERTTRAKWPKIFAGWIHKITGR